MGVHPTNRNAYNTGPYPSLNDSYGWQKRNGVVGEALCLELTELWPIEVDTRVLPDKSSDAAFYRHEEAILALWVQAPASWLLAEIFTDPFG